MKKLIIRILPVLLLACILAPGSRAAVVLPPIFGSHMMVQQGETLNLWGWADAGEKVTIRLGGVVVATVVGEGRDKAWKAKLPAQKEGPVADIEVTGSNKITLTDNAGSGFESDNHTVRTAAWGSDTNDVGPYLPGVPVEEVVNVAGSQTVITNTALMNPLVVSAPEPGMNALFAMAGLAGLAMVARRRAVKA